MRHTWWLGILAGGALYLLGHAVSGVLDFSSGDHPARGVEIGEATPLLPLRLPSFPFQPLVLDFQFADAR